MRGPHFKEAAGGKGRVGRGRGGVLVTHVAYLWHQVRRRVTQLLERRKLLPGNEPNQTATKPLLLRLIYYTSSRFSVLIPQLAGERYRILAVRVLGVKKQEFFDFTPPPPQHTHCSSPSEPTRGSGATVHSHLAPFRLRPLTIRCR